MPISNQIFSKCFVDYHLMSIPEYCTAIAVSLDTEHAPAAQGYRLSHPNRLPVAAGWGGCAFATCSRMSMTKTKEEPLQIVESHSFAGFEEIEIRLVLKEHSRQLAKNQINAEKGNFRASSVRAHWLAGSIQKLLSVYWEQPLSSHDVQSFCCFQPKLRTR